MPDNSTRVEGDEAPPPRKWSTRFADRAPTKLFCDECGEITTHVRGSAPSPFDPHANCPAEEQGKWRMCFPLTPEMRGLLDQYRAANPATREPVRPTLGGQDSATATTATPEAYSPQASSEKLPPASPPKSPE